MKIQLQEGKCPRSGHIARGHMSCSAAAMSPRAVGRGPVFSESLPGKIKYFKKKCIKCFHPGILF